MVAAASRNARSPVGSSETLYWAPVGQMGLPMSDITVWTSPQPELPTLYKAEIRLEGHMSVAPFQSPSLHAMFLTFSEAEVVKRLAFVSLPSFPCGGCETTRFHNLRSSSCGGCEATRFHNLRSCNCQRC